jgi:hypothetical protein
MIIPNDGRHMIVSGIYSEKLFNTLKLSTTSVHMLQIKNINFDKI